MNYNTVEIEYVLNHKVKPNFFQMDMIRNLLQHISSTLIAHQLLSQNHGQMILILTSLSSLMKMLCCPCRVNIPWSLYSLYLVFFYLSKY